MSEWDWKLCQQFGSYKKWCKYEMCVQIETRKKEKKGYATMKKKTRKWRSRWKRNGIRFWMCGKKQFVSVEMKQNETIFFLRLKFKWVLVNNYMLWPFVSCTDQ